MTFLPRRIPEPPNSKLTDIALRPEGSANRTRCGCWSKDVQAGMGGQIYNFRSMIDEAMNG